MAQIETMKGFAYRLWHCGLENCRFQSEDTGSMRAHLIKWHQIPPDEVSFYGLSKHLANRVKKA